MRSLAWLLTFVALPCNARNLPFAPLENEGNVTANLQKRFTNAPQYDTDRVSRWVALGDSFSAGPGAGAPAPGDERQCRRRLGAYPPLLQSSSLFQQGYSNPEFIFQSCTGDEIPQVKI